MHNNKDQRGNPTNPTRFWILGAGRFGQIAVKRITRHIPEATITVVDQKPSTMDGKDISAVREDGIQWLNRTLDPNASVDLIIPAIPVHVAAEWLKLNLKHLFHINPLLIQDSWLTRLPHAMRGKTGQAFVSHADFICPDNCAEPAKICTHTGKPRPMDLFRLLGKFDLDDVRPIVIRSHQLLPGVGGIYPADLMAALDTVCNHNHRPMMIATACRCHGVVDFMRLNKKAVRPVNVEPCS
ncbi:potassium transporter [Desulfosarcina sp.]|uniref:potassium transporter n=1 Tax=Desulfosarcina sp. TaxID=2027861 RepID=UPI0029B5AB90|nr:potassium transporter [Desulfosarcina sp.]MDX2453654.1 potassium transporter [Desulfosarcina sp.]MDX2491361.1 potassium transporter [Desulfosarcina sp.]